MVAAHIHHRRCLEHLGPTATALHPTPQAAGRLDMVALLRRYRSMIARLVAEPGIPANRPQRADQPEGNEDHAPLQPSRQGDDHEWRQPARQMRGGEEYALDAAALGKRNPARIDPGHAGPGAGFADAE